MSSHLEFPKEFPFPFFINRENELKTVLAEGAHSYFIIYAQEGYGKTSLLKEIKRKLEEKEKERICCIHIDALSTATGDSATAFLYNLISCFDEKIELNSERTKLIATVTKIIEKKIEYKKKIIFLVDTERTNSRAIRHFLSEEFIPHMHERLFFSKDIDFQFVLSGIFSPNYFSHSVSENTRINFIPLPLSLFDYKLVAEAVQKYISKSNYNIISPYAIATAAAHLMFFSGGHPGCIAKLLSDHGELIYNATNDFFSGTGREICQRIITGIAEGIRNSFDKSLHEILDTFSTVRYADDQVIRSLFNLKNQKEVDTLSDSLTQTHLFKRPDRLLYNDTIHRMLAIRLRLVDPDKFYFFCRKAQKMCAKQIENSNIQRPEKWFVEYLFQILQEKNADKKGVLCIRDERKKLESAFLDEELPHILRKYTASRTGSSLKEERRALKEAVRKDHELRFTLNYLFRNDQYNEEPYIELQKRIKAFFESREMNIKSILEEKKEEGRYDVFLCHNNIDKAAVKRVGEALKEQGILPWLDEWDLQPGKSWQRVLQDQITKVKTAAVFVGSSGMGPWQDIEINGLLTQFVKRDASVIPVILPGCENIPTSHLFLDGLCAADFRKVDPDPLGQLIWGITGNRPDLRTSTGADSGIHSDHAEQLNLLDEIRNIVCQENERILEQLSGRLNQASLEILQELNHSQVAVVNAFATAIDADCISKSDADELLEVVCELRSNLPDKSTVANALQVFDPVVDDPKANVSNRLKVTLPIIPLLLSYEGEYELTSGINLKSILQRIVQGIKI